MKKKIWKNVLLTILNNLFIKITIFLVSVNGTILLIGAAILEWIIDNNQLRCHAISVHSNILLNYFIRGKLFYINL